MEKIEIKEKSTLIDKLYPFVVAFLIICFVLFVIFFSIFLMSATKQEKVIDKITAGRIVEKKIEDLESTTDYRIYIGIEYEFEGEKYTSTKYFSVDMDTYLDYEIGDWFDSQTLDKNYDDSSEEN